MMMDASFKHCAIVILAAGISERLGRPKQLLLYKGKSLLEQAVDTALETGCQKVYMVLGKHFELLQKEIKDKPVIVIENAGWQEGIASSIRCGLEKVISSMEEPDAVIFIVCDQPFVTSTLLRNLWEKKQETGKAVVACSYGDIRGVPALFHKSFFPALMELRGDSGAGKIIRANIEHVAEVPFPEGNTDIDTALDYELLLKGD